MDETVARRDPKAKIIALPALTTGNRPAAGVTFKVDRVHIRMTE